MRAHDLAEHFPVVGLDDDARAAAWQMASESRPGLIVLDADNHPCAILPGSQVLRFLLPQYIQEDPALARALSEKASDEMVQKLMTVPVRALLPRSGSSTELPVVDGDATVLEIAAVMAKAHSPLVAVVVDGELVGAITMSRLLQRLVGEQP